MPAHFRYFTVQKPFGMLSQFSREGDHPTLADLQFSFEKDVYPVGRLDADSEGLLFLTNDPSINARLLNPHRSHTREYWAQVEGKVTEDAVHALSEGVVIRINGQSFRTKPAVVHQIPPPEFIPDRVPPIRFRASIPTSWISLAITEGKNRQVRRMTAAVGFPTLRLIRVRIGQMTLTEWSPGSVTEWSARDCQRLLLSQF